MKAFKATIRLLPLLLLFASCTEKEDSEGPERQAVEAFSPPSTVLDAFQTGNPGAQQVAWEKDGDNFETTFELGGMNKSIVFDATGKVLETEGEVAVSSLLPAITGYIGSNYAEYAIGVAEVTESAEGTFFEILLAQSGEESLEVVFDETGNFVKVAEVEEAEEGEEMGEDADDESDEQGENEEEE